LAADQNDAQAQFKYGLCLAKGDGVRLDFMKSARYFRLAARLGSEAIPELCHSGDDFELPISMAIARAWYSQASNRDTTYQLDDLGKQLEFGQCAAKDVALAADCYSASARQGNSRAQANFGFCLEHGLGIERNPDECLKFYESSVVRTNRTGAAHYANSLHFGIGFHEDMEAACDHYEFALSDPHDTVVRNAFRCLRALNKAKLRPRRPMQTVDEPVKASMPGTPEAPLGFEVTSLIDSYRTREIGLSEEHIIGKGGFSLVTVSTDRKTGKRIAVKHLSVANAWNTFIREVESMVKLRHPCVIRIHGWANSRHSACGEIHMEFAQNYGLDHLLDLVRLGHPTILRTPTGKGRLICQIVLGMRYVHAQGIIHRDLKPGNILLDEHWGPKISDFGLSRFESVEGPPTANTGTVWYAAPEQLVEDAPHTKKTDVFSFGYILYEIVTGRAVFPPWESQMGVLRRILVRDFPALPDQFGPLMQGLIRRCWSVDPFARPSFEEIFCEFQDCGFDILPNVNPEAIRKSIDEVLAFEAETTGQKI
jgi:hypothetical protein